MSAASLHVAYQRAKFAALPVSHRHEPALRAAAIIDILQSPQHRLHASDKVALREPLTPRPAPETKSLALTDGWRRAQALHFRLWLSPRIASFAWL
jgi:hypothetical protein